jgi:MFS transporter, MHS family, shikimate and dehydroshikimate transport protein
LDNAKRSAHWKTIFSSTFIGSLIEWYDYYVFGIASALVFNVLFFPKANAAVGTLLSFAVFATAWLTRPLGGIIFGHLGDRIGRKKVLLITLWVMGISTFIVGLLPTYDQIGIAAPVLLVLVRLLQGISSGGEWSAAAVSATESAPEGRRGLYGSFPQLGIPVALLISNGLSWIFYSLPPSALLSYGWRMPFLLSILVVALGQYIRRRMPETPEFEQAKERHEVIELPLKQALKHHWRPIIIVLFIAGGINAFFFTFTTFALSYATTHAGFTRSQILLSIITASLVHTVGTALWGRLSDFTGRRPLYLMSLALLTFSPFVLFWLIQQRSVALFSLGLSVFFGLGHSCVWSISGAYFTELFPRNVRVSGSAIGYQFASTIFGGPIPLVATALVQANGGEPWYVATMISCIAVVAFIAALIGPAAAASRENRAMHVHT